MKIDNVVVNEEDEWFMAANGKPITSFPDNDSELEDVEFASGDQHWNCIGCDDESTRLNVIHFMYS